MNQRNKRDINGRSRSLINDLPDNILSNILSFLPTKEAVRTSILSKRWEFIWTTIPELGFDQGDTETNTFMNFVERALSLRQSSKITKFQLIGHMNSSCSLQAVISTVEQCHVEELELHLQNIINGEALTLPLKLFNSATLTQLHVKMLRRQKLILPFLISLPSLKLLKLWNITFPNQHSAQNLFYGYPALEHLQLEDCKWLNVETVRASSSNLQKLIINEAHCHGQQNGQKKTEFVILGSGLRHFDYVGFLYFDYCIMNPALLEEVTINIDDYDSSHQNRVLITNHLLKLLRSVSHVPKLMLGRRTTSLLIGVPEAVNVPVFMGVRLLEIEYRSSDFSNPGLLRLLENTPYLQSLLFHGGIRVPFNPVEDGILDPVPACFLNNLNYVFVHVMYGDAMDLVGIKILLKNAKVLKKTQILVGLL